MQLDPAIQEALREHARQGASVPDLVRLLRQWSNLDRSGEGRLLVVPYFVNTFGIPLPQALEICGWVGFDDGGGTSDDELQNLLGHYVRIELESCLE